MGGRVVIMVQIDWNRNSTVTMIQQPNYGRYCWGLRKLYYSGKKRWSTPVGFRFSEPNQLWWLHTLRGLWSSKMPKISQGNTWYFLNLQMDHCHGYVELPDAIHCNIVRSFLTAVVRPIWGEVPGHARLQKRIWPICLAKWGEEPVLHELICIR